MKPFFEKSQRESTAVQAPAIEYMKQRGWFVEAVQSKSRNGFPDTFAARNAVIVLCEFKKTGEVPTEQQKIRHGQLQEAGVTVVWFDNMDDVKAFFK